MQRKFGFIVQNSMDSFVEFQVVLCIRSGIRNIALKRVSEANLKPSE
jgi:hypothetical protein